MTATSAILNLEQMTALYRLGKLVRASLDLDSTLAAIADAACELTQAELSAILLLDDDDQLVLRVGRGAMAAAIGERVPASAGIVGRALREGRPVLVPDMQAEPHRARPDLDARSGVRAYLAAPLIWESLALGVVTVAATVPGALGPRDAALVQELAEHAAAAVAHARAFAREQAERAETQDLNRELAEQTHHFEQVQRQLIQTEKLTAMGQLAHGIAHELNTPLGVIVSNLAVLSEYGSSLAEFALAAGEAVARLQQHEAPSSVAEALETAARSADLGYILADLPQLTSESTASADRIAMLVRSMATFASKGSDKLAAVSVEEALEAAITLAWNELKHRAQVVRNFAGVPMAMGQLSELAQVFVHLLLNAAHSLEDRQGTITLTTAVDGDQVVVALSDDGCGIAPEHLPRVFDPFFSTREPGLGTGMGLAVCHGIVARFGGTIGVDSGLGRGTTVTVRLQLAELALREAA